MGSYGVTMIDLLRRLFLPYESLSDPFLLLEVTFKMVLAVGLSSIIGWERERAEQPAGLRTHIILCVGATLLTVVSMRIVLDMGSGDPTRIMGQIVSGIGFLGAGAIMRLGLTVRGLTTATTLWGITGVGMAVGAGYYFPAAIAVGAMYVVLHYFELFEVRIESRRLMHLMVVADSRPGLVGEVEALLSDLGCSVRSLRVYQRTAKNAIDIEGLVKLGSGIDTAPVVEALLAVDGVRESHLT